MKTVNDLIESGKIKNLEVTNLSLNSKKLISLEGIEKLQNLKKLDVTGNDLIDLNHIEKLSKLVYLNCGQMSPTLVDMSAVANITTLEVLMFGNAGVSKIDFLSNLVNLKELFMYHVKNVKDYSPIENLSNLKNICCSQVYGLKDISFLSNLHKLEEIEVQGNEITSIRPLSNLSLLKSIDCSFNKIESMEGIEKLHKLETLRFNSNPCSLKYFDIDNKSCIIDDKERIEYLRNTLLYVEKHLIPEDDLRGAASIMDTGLFDFKTIK